MYNYNLWHKTEYQTNFVSVMCIVFVISCYGKVGVGSQKNFKIIIDRCREISVFHENLHIHGSDKICFF